MNKTDIKKEKQPSSNKDAFLKNQSPPSKLQRKITEYTKKLKRSTRIQEKLHKWEKTYTSMQTKFIFVTGGVMSGLGKGVVSASISKLLQLSDQ